jgi:hypothetical protein
MFIIPHDHRFQEKIVQRASIFYCDPDVEWGVGWLSMI